MWQSLPIFKTPLDIDERFFSEILLVRVQTFNWSAKIVRGRERPHPVPSDTGLPYSYGDRNHIQGYSYSYGDRNHTGLLLQLR